MPQAYSSYDSNRVVSMPSSTTTNTTFRLSSSGYVSAAAISKSGKEMRSSSESVGAAPTKPKQSKSRNGEQRHRPYVAR